MKMWARFGSRRKKKTAGARRRKLRDVKEHQNLVRVGSRYKRKLVQFQRHFEGGFVLAQGTRARSRDFKARQGWVRFGSKCERKTTPTENPPWNCGIVLG